MAMLDYGAVVKKDGRIISDVHGDLFQNLTELSGGELHEEYEDILLEGDKEPTHTLVKSEYIGDESVRAHTVNLSGPVEWEKKSVIHNYFAVVGDKDFLIAIYKWCLLVFDHEKEIAYYGFGDGDLHYEDSLWRIKHKVVKHLETPFGDIKIKEWDNKNIGTAAFRYKGHNYEILFGYGVDVNVNYIFSNTIYKYLSKKLANRIRRWFKQGEKKLHEQR